MINATICNIYKHIVACYVACPYNSNVIYHLVQNSQMSKVFRRENYFWKTIDQNANKKAKMRTRKLGRKSVNQFLEKNVLHRVIYMQLLAETLMGSHFEFFCQKCCQGKRYANVFKFSRQKSYKKYINERLFLHTFVIIK